MKTKKEPKKKTVKDRYISLTEATHYCNYSQEYLSLRARNGKLKAIKQGRNWVTKKEWITKYVQGIEKYNSSLMAKKKVETVKKTIPKPIKTKEIRVEAKPPENLPIERKIKKTKVKLLPPMIALLSVSLFVLGFFVGERSFQPAKNFIVGASKEAGYVISKEISPTDLSGAINNIFQNTLIFFQDFKQGLKNIAPETKALEREAVFYSYVLAEAGNIITEETVKLFEESFATVSRDVNEIAAVAKGKGARQLEAHAPVEEERLTVKIEWLEGSASIHYFGAEELSQLIWQLSH